MQVTQAYKNVTYDQDQCALITKILSARYYELRDRECNNPELQDEMFREMDAILMILGSLVVAV
jgi:hypothetical protein